MDMTATRSAMVCAALLGGWILVCPWVVSIDMNTAWSFRITGAISVILALVAIIRADDFAHYGLVIAGAWLFVSPWLVGSGELPTRQSILYGVVLGGLAWFGRPSYKPKVVASLQSYDL
jgi:hypothetical protein